MFTGSPVKDESGSDEGPYEIELTATDRLGAFASTAFTFLVDDGINELPTLTLTSSATPSFTEGVGNPLNAVVATFTTADPDGGDIFVSLSDTSNYTLGTGVNEGKVLLSRSGALKVIRGQDLPAFTLTPTDGLLGNTSSTVNPVVVPTNDLPRLQAQLIGPLTEDSGLTAGSAIATFSTTDEEGGSVSVYSGVSDGSSKCGGWKGTRPVYPLRWAESRR